MGSCTFNKLLGMPNAGLSRRAAGRFRAPGSPGAERREGAPAQPRILPERSEGGNGSAEGRGFRDPLERFVMA